MFSLSNLSSQDFFISFENVLVAIKTDNGWEFTWSKGNTWFLKPDKYFPCFIESLSIIFKLSQKNSAFLKLETMFKIPAVAPCTKNLSKFALLLSSKSEIALKLFKNRKSISAELEIESKPPKSCDIFCSLEGLRSSFDRRFGARDR